MPTHPSLTIDHESTTPAYRQIYQQIRESIETGEMPAGTKLPKIRELASELGIARNTVEAAYKQLGLEGYAKGKRGVGYVVEDLDFSIADSKSEQKEANSASRANYSRHVNPLGDSFGCRYDFSYGNRDPQSVPLALIKVFADRALGEHDPAGSSTYIDPFGLPELRKCLAEHVNETREMHCVPENVIVQPGTQSALNSIISLFPYEERRIAMENPGYDAARLVFEERASHLSVIPTYRGMNALLRGLEESEARLVFFTPSNQFPLGYIMPLATRLKIIDWAKRTDSYIIEDDYCCEYRYGSSPIPSLHSLCPSRVIYMGTMSKIFTPAIRLSYVVLPSKLAERWDEVHRYRFCEVPWLDQEMLRLFMESPDWKRYEHSTFNLYRKRHDLLIASIQKEMGDKVTMVGTDAGLHILLGDNEKRDQRELISLAREQDVRVYETDRYWLGKARPMSNFVLVGFSSMQEKDIPEGIRRLAKAWYG